MKETTITQQKNGPGAGKADKKSTGFTDEERAAMKARAKELKAEARASATRADGEKDLLAAVAAMPEPDRGMGERLHAIISESAPSLSPKTWYGMPAYANEDGKVVCFFRGSDKFKERYLTFGFNQEARLDEGTMWPIVFAVTELTPAEEAKVAALMKRAVS